MAVGPEHYREATVGFLTPAASPPGVTGFPIDESFILSGATCPGQWLLVDASKRYSFQEQKAVGYDGASLQIIGRELVHAKFRGKLWTPTQAEAYNVFRKLFLNRPLLQLGPLVGLAYSISHTELNAMGVSNVVVKEFSPLVQEEGGLWTAHVEFIEYLPPIVSKSRPTQAEPPGPNITPSGPQTAAAAAATSDLTNVVGARRR